MILDQIHPFVVLTIVFLRAYGLMGCDVPQSGRNAPTFWRNLHVCPAGYTLKISKCLNKSYKASYS